MSVWLELITGANWRAALDVRVSADQLPMVADYQPVALMILAKTQVVQGGGDWEPLAILSDDALVGVVGIVHRDGKSFMENLAIDQQWQRQGIGSAAVSRMVSRCRSRGSTEILLTVHDDNAGAQKLYRSEGFEPTGRRPYGDPEWRLSLE